MDVVWVGREREGSDTSFETIGTEERMELEGGGREQGAGEDGEGAAEGLVWSKVLGWWEDGWDGVELSLGSQGGKGAGSAVQGDCAAGLSQVARKGRRRRARKHYDGVVGIN